LPRKNPKEIARAEAKREERKERVARGLSRRSLATSQFFFGIVLLASALFGIYLLATDASLWILAASHAYGLFAIVGIDLVLGVLNLFAVKQAFLPSIAGALLGTLLQVGDIVTASQYNMTIAYFASYLFGLPAFDALLATQILVILIGVTSRGHVRTLTSERGDVAPEFSASRREFLKAMVISGVVVAVASVFSVVGQSRPSLPTTQPSGLPAGAVANVNQVSSGNPAYFEFPTGYPNILLKKSDGNLIALSMLCTQVCCQLSYVTGNQLYCPCHGSLFDENGNVTQGPAVLPLPTIEFTQDNSGNVFATRVNGSSPCIQG
jgi:thiosulfate dehydrogenase (quinone) large subunit